MSTIVISLTLSIILFHNYNYNVLLNLLFTLRTSDVLVTLILSLLN